jgi:hypothetical protein
MPCGSCKNRCFDVTSQKTAFFNFSFSSM